MGRLILYTLTSLDGAVDDPRRFFPATGDRISVPVFDDDLVELESRLIARQGAVLMGRGMYDEWSAYWPTSTEQPFADFINSVRKYVVTSTPLARGWPNAEAVTAPLGPLVEDLKARTTGDIGVHGSITLARSLLAEGLVDELVLVVGRVVDPEGRRLFDGRVGRRDLMLLEAHRTSGGSVWLRYAFPS